MSFQMLESLLNTFTFQLSKRDCDLTDITNCVKRFVRSVVRLFTAMNVVLSPGVTKKKK